MTTMAMENEHPKFLYALFSAVITVAAGAFIGFISGSGDGYGAVTRPDWTPPDAVFPIAWTILYALMGISSYLIFTRPAPYSPQKTLKYLSLILYFSQLALNFAYPFIFFRAQSYLTSFIILALISASVAALFVVDLSLSKPAAFMLIPYLVWLAFAAYLNAIIAAYN